MKHVVILAPGFFGFVNFGRLVYFSHVREMLAAKFREYDVDVDIVRARVSPTASVRIRATQLAACVREAAATSDGPIHLIGHSTGGLDARLMVSPGVDLADDQLEALAARVRSVVTVATPHYGTPLATFFTGMLGQRLLGLLSLATANILREGRLPLSVLARIGAATARIGLPGGNAVSLLDHLRDELIGRLPAEEQNQFSAFFSDMGSDQALLPQLTPDGLDLLNASTTDRPSTRYGCVLARSPKPRLSRHLRMRSAYEQATYGLYRVLYSQTRPLPQRYTPRLSDEQRGALVRMYGATPTREDNDAFVPTLSQTWGKVVAAVEGDHLDVIGHFNDERHDPPHYDLISTGARFSRRDFEQLWTAVVDFCLDAPSNQGLLFH